MFAEQAEVCEITERKSAKKEPFVQTECWINQEAEATVGWFISLPLNSFHSASQYHISSSTVIMVGKINYVIPMKSCSVLHQIQA